MISRSMRSIPPSFNPCNPSLIFPLSSAPTNHPIHSSSGHRRRQKPFPPPNQSQISALLSSLPPRFTSSHLSSTIKHLPNPLLSLPLLQSTIHKPHLLLSSSPFLSAIKLLAHHRLFLQMDSVASLAFSLPSLPLPTSFFNTLIHFYSQARWTSKAIGVYKLMNSRPNSLTFNLLFAAILNNRRGPTNSYVNHLYMAPLRSLFRQMIQSDVKPNIYSLNSLIKGYVMSLHVNDALRVFHQMGPVYGVEPDGSTYGCLVHGLCAQGRTRNAREMFGEMRGKGLVGTWRGWSSLVCALAMEGEVGEAKGVLWEGVGMGRRPDFVMCRTVVEEVRRREGEGEARVILREMRGREVVCGKWYEELVDGLRGEFCD